MIKKLAVLFLIFILSPLCASAIQARNGQLVKVGISDNNFSKYYYDEIEVSATDDFELINKDTETVISEFLANTTAVVKMHDNLFDVYMNGKEVAKDLNGPIAVSSKCGFIYIPNLKRAGKPALYRGIFELTKSPVKDSLFSVINILDLESYLRGVVPNEMPTYFGLEALKAQTVTARNYVLKPREKNYHNFDVCDSVACQVYFGAATESEISDKAVVETQNIVAMHEGEMILALYSSTAGGYTESYENAFSDPNSKSFPALPKPYLKGVPDNDKIPKLDTEGAVRSFYLSSPLSFDNKSPYYRWTKEWNGTELENVLKKTLKKNSATGFVKPELYNESDFGKLKDIRVIKRGVSGKVIALEIRTDKNTYIVQKELIIRRVFEKDKKPLPSANIIFDINRNSKGYAENITVHGGGFGHGVGMSQYGAGMMSSMGYSYDEILKHYYSGIDITTYPVTLSNETNQDIKTINFYTKNKKTILVVENKFQFTDLIAAVNSKELKIELAPHLFKLARIDLTPYIKNGVNSVTFILPYTDSRKKSVRLYLELNGSEKN